MIRNFTIIVCIACGIVLANCSSPNSDSDDSGSTLTSRTIDSSGGTLESETVSLTVPPGAFSGAALIKLAAAESQSSNRYTVSKAYTVEGIPPDYRSPIEVRLKYTGALSYQSYIIASRKIGNPAPGEPDSAPLYLPAHESGGYLAATLPATGKTAKPGSAHQAHASDAEVFVIEAVTGFGQFAEKEHFTIRLPQYYQTFGASLGESLEEAYEYFQELGFNLTIPNHPYGALDSVVVCLNFFDTGMGIVPSWFEFTPGVIRPLLLVNDTVLAASLNKETRLEAAAGLFGLIQGYYDALRNENNWFNFGAREWFMGKYSGDTSYTPDSFNVYPLGPLKGFRPYTIEPVPRNKLWLMGSFSAFVAHLDSRYNILGGDRVLRTIYDEMYKGKPAVSAVSEAIHSSETVWWPDFLESYLGGNIYGYGSENFIKQENIAGSFTATTIDTLETFTEPYGAFESRLYKIAIDDDLAKSLKNITFSVKGADLPESGAAVMIFRMADGKLTCIGRGDTVSLTSPADRTLYALVTVPHADPARMAAQYSVSLTVRADRTPPSSPYAFTKASFKVKLNARLLRQRTNNKDEEIDSLLEPAIYPVIVDGSLVGNLFSGTKTLTTTDGTESYAIKAVFDDAFEKIVSYEVTVSINKKDMTYDIGVTGGAIPYSSVLSGWRIFQISGENTCAALTNYRYVTESVSVALGQTITTRYELIDFSCGKESLVYLQFK